MAEPDDVASVVAQLREHGVRRVHVLAWRDLDDPDAGGSEVHADECLSRWSAAGLDIAQRTSGFAGGAVDIERNGYRAMRRGSRYSVFPQGIGAEIRRRMGPADALVEIWNGVPWFSPIWCRRPSITMFHHVHGPMWDQLFSPTIAWMGKRLETRVAPPFYRRRLTVVPSDSTRDALLELGFRPAMVRAVPNGIDASFTPGGVRNAHPTVVSVARLAPVKRHTLLVDAAVAAKRLVPGLQLVIVGDGPMRPELAQHIDSVGAHDWITLRGHLTRPELVEEYRRAWLVASASMAEGWGLALTEAASCGIPAVATDISGHQSSVIDGITGDLAPIEGLGDAMARLLNDDARRERLGQAALTRAKTLTWDATATGVLAALRDEVLRRRPTKRARF